MLELQNIKTGYGQGLVLKGASLSIQPGDLHGILGVNGAGKTTLFRTICGDMTAQEGEVKWMSKTLKRKDCSYLVTKPNFYPYMTGKEYLSLISRNKSNFDYLQWNELFQLPLDAMVREYSTGMKKKIAFLSNIAQDRPIMILDEPFNGVDLESNEKLMEIIQRLRNENRVILLASHMIDSLAAIADKISLLDQGVFQETIEKEQFDTWSQQFKSEMQGQIAGQLDQLLP